MSDDYYTETLGDTYWIDSSGNRWSGPFSKSLSFQSTPIKGVSPRKDGKLLLRPNAFSRTIFKQYNSVVHWSFYLGGNQVAVPDYADRQVYVGSSFSNKVANQAIAKWYGDAASFQANMLDLLRTRIEAANMVTGILGQLARAARFTKRGQFEKAVRALSLNRSRKKEFTSKDVSGRWLELQYGWAPLLGDIYTICNREEPIEGWVRARSKDSRHLNTRPSHPSSYVNGANYVDCMHEVSATVSAFITVDMDHIRALSTMGVTNPALTAWEAVPWSFVLDWFIPVGDYLESISALHGISTSLESLTVTERFYGDAKIENNGYTMKGPINSSPFVYSSKKRTLGLPSMPLPTFENPFSATRALNAISLIHQNLRR